MRTEVLPILQEDQIRDNLSISGHRTRQDASIEVETADVFVRLLFVIFERMWQLGELLSCW